jgi:hypothetical protein
MTTPGMVMGSPDYMAPEQGAGRDASAASDIYAVGCILFEMLTGRLPFEGDNPIDVIEQKIAMDAPSVTSLRPEVPGPLARVVAHCLERRSEDRPASMRAVEYELTRAVDGRASAVAAVLGLNMPPEDRPSSSSQMSRDAVSGRAASGPSASAVARVQGQAAAQSGRRARAKKASSGGLAVVLKAMLLVIAVGVVAAGAAFALNPDLRSRLRARLAGAASHAARAVARSEATAARQRAAPTSASQTVPSGGGGSTRATPSAVMNEASAAVAGTAAAPVATSHTPNPGVSPTVFPTQMPAPGAAPVVDTGQGSAAASQGSTPAPAGTGVAPPGGVDAVAPAQRGAASGASTASGARSVEAMVERAEQALAEGRWREPPERSLALELVNIALVDPGNEAIARLRREAATRLMPIGEDALARKQWMEAASAFRDLTAVWPDNQEARERLGEALERQARVLRRYGDHEAVLATADEWLNLSHSDFDALMIRAGALFALERWAEAKDAYAAARAVRPRSKKARKGYRRAAFRLRKSEANK